MLLISTDQWDIIPRCNPKPSTCHKTEQPWQHFSRQHQCAECIHWRRKWKCSSFTPSRVHYLLRVPGWQTAARGKRQTESSASGQRVECAGGGTKRNNQRSRTRSTSWTAPADTCWGSPQFREYSCITQIACISEPKLAMSYHVLCTCCEI